MGLLSSAENFIKDTFSASSPPPPISKIASKPPANAGSGSSESQAQANQKKVKSGTDNPYMVWINGFDKTMVGDVDQASTNIRPLPGQIHIDGLLRETFDIPLQAHWAPVLPQMAGDVAGIIGGVASGLAGKLASATAGGAGGGIASRLAGLTEAGSNLVSNGFTAANQASNNLTGESLTNPSWYQLVWQGSSPITFNLPMSFVTMEDPDTDVIHPVAVLQKFLLPNFTNGSLRAPGYHPFNGWAGVGNALTGNGFQRLKDTYRLDIHIGNTMVFRNVVITQVNSHFNTMPSIQGGKFHKVDVDLAVTTQEVITKDTVNQIFKRPNTKQFNYDDADPVQSTKNQATDLKNRAVGSLTNAAQSAAHSVGNFLSDSHLG